MSDSATPAAPANRLPGWAWALLPALAALAWAPALSLWFISDDFQLLRVNARQPWPTPFLLLDSPMFYRPLSTALSWNLGITLFGTNAFAYHAVSLALHALVAWLLGRAVAAIFDHPRLGWATGALFGLWPLATEPVGWLAAQWDLWAAACGVATLWGFAAARRRGSWRVGGLALLAYAAGLLMKETILPLPALLPVVAWVVDGGPSLRGAGWRAGGRWILPALPFAGLTALFVGARFLASGRVGGYSAARADVLNFLPDRILSAVLQTLMPLNRDLFAAPLLWAVGGVVAVWLGAGLVLGWRRDWRVPVLGLAWFAVFLVPILNILLSWGDNPNGEGNRLLYLSAMGFCLILAYPLTLVTLTARRVGVIGGGVALAAALIAACWVQLQPAQHASRQTERLLAETRVLWPTILHRRVGFYVQDLPDKYQGSYVFRNGFAEGLTIFGGQSAWVTPTLALDPAALTGLFGDQAGLANLAIGYDPATTLYHVDSLAAVTIAQPPPPGPAWDFRRCDPAALAAWQPQAADWRCTPAGDESYATFTPRGPEPALTLVRAPAPTIAPAGWARLAVCLRRSTATPATAQWAWSGGSIPPFPLALTPDWRVYWTYIPARALGPALQEARLSLPADSVDVQWLAITPIFLP